MITRWVAGVVVLFGILLMMLPKTDEASRSKVASGSMLMCTLDLRQRVEAQLVRGEPVSERFRNTCPDLIASVEVDALGTMVITGNRYPLTMTLNPVREGERIRWSCRGEPAGAIAKLCKP